MNSCILNGKFWNCFESFEVFTVFSLILLGYISTAINDGPGCLLLRCPDPSCGAAVGQDMINLVASNEDKEKYSRYFIRSYIEDNRKVIPCWKFDELFVGVHSQVFFLLLTC